MEIEDEIPIEIDDDKLFTQIAFIIDRPQIHKDLKKFRQKWQKKSSSEDLLLFLHTESFKDIEIDAEKIIKKHQLPPQYAFVVLQVLLQWKVKSSLNDLGNVFGKSTKNEPTLLIKQNDKFIKIPLETNQYKFIKERGKIRKHRSWYWMNYKTNPNRMGYRKISQVTGVNMETIKSGIKAYANFLKASFL